ncbi:GTP-binding protein, partial [Escherichia sp. SP-MK2]
MVQIALRRSTDCLGKTTLLRHILNEQHGYKIAVIENEF